MTRRTFLAAALSAAAAPKRQNVYTVRGPVAPKDLGSTLMHEHILVDFIGADQASASRYNADEVVAAALPKLKQVRDRGCRTLVECTPAYLGRDPILLQRLSAESGLHIVTNTGYYGANKDKHVPAHAYKDSVEQLAARWISEYEKGIDGTSIKPGFMKIGVDAGRLSGVDEKLVAAGGLCHKATGLRLHVHTGDGAAAADILNMLERQNVPGSAYVWVHAQNERNRENHVMAAEAGAWVEFDGINAKSLDRHLTPVVEMIERGFIDNLLISQDSGWYRVGEPGGGQFNPYTYLFDMFVPELKKRGITDAQVAKLLVTNPARVLAWA